MAQSGYTPISLYFSATGAAVPSAGNLVAGELALNTNDGKLYFKNSSGVVTLLASATTVTNSFSAGTTGLTPNTATTGAVTLAGTLAVANGGTGLTAGTSGGVLAYTAAGTLVSSNALAANALVIGGGAVAAPSTTTTGTGVVTALGVNTGSAGAFVVNGGALGTPSGGTVTNLTGTASININGTVGATTATTGAFTTVVATKATAGDVITFTNGGATPKAGYLFSSSNFNGLFADASAAGTGVAMTSGTSTTIFSPDQTKSLAVSNTGTAVTGTLSATGDVTLSGGTANGVAYLNGSKVLTTGSALVFDGTNLGVGVTPTTGWYSLIKANQTLSASFAGLTSGTSYVTYVGSNWFVNTVAADKYIANGFASLYTQASGQHQWSTAGSNSSGAGAALTFTQAMTLDESNRLLIGTTVAPASSQIKLLINSSSANGGIQMNFGGGTGGAALVPNNGAGLIFYTYTGALGSESYTQAMTLDASGNLYVGATALSSNANYFAYSPGNTFADFGHVTGVATTTPYTRFLYAGGAIGSITQSGTTAVLYNTTSDQRLKENIQDSDSASSLIDSLQVRKFDWKSDNSHQRYGFVAQELVTVAPEAVNKPNDPDEMMAVDYSKLVPMLVKEIQSLRKRLTALEGKA